MRSHFHAVNSDLDSCQKLAADREIAAELSLSLLGVSLGWITIYVDHCKRLHPVNSQPALLVQLPCIYLSHL